MIASNITNITKGAQLAFICPECKGALSAGREGDLVCERGHTYAQRDGVRNLLPSDMDPISQGDAVYHSSVRESWIESNQVDALRNRYYHQQVTSYIAEHSGPGTNILELGGGVGYDLELFLGSAPKYGNYVFSEIAEQMVSYVRQRLGSPRAEFCCIDAHNIPFAAAQFDFIFMIATLHHFSDMDKVMAELTRVLKPGGCLIFAIEPNALWMRFFERTRGFYRRILSNKYHSPADEEAPGFTAGSFDQIAARYGLSVVRVQPVWLFSGFAHFGLEFVFRLLRLRKRLRLPRFVEAAFIRADNALLAGSKVGNLAFHFTAILRKGPKEGRVADEPV
jgi:ubiquinone/menaquinone biosynthesis C-methylase UbiE/uncharacterized protein YbaR (Trm112 family)